MGLAQLVQRGRDAWSTLSLLGEGVSSVGGFGDALLGGGTRGGILRSPVTGESVGFPEGGGPDGCMEGELGLGGALLPNGPLLVCATCSCFMRSARRLAAGLGGEPAGLPPPLPSAGTGTGCGAGLAPPPPVLPFSWLGTGCC